MLLVVFAFSVTYFCRELENVKVFIIYKLTALSGYRWLRRYERGLRQLKEGLLYKGIGIERRKQTNRKQTKKENTKQERLAKKKLYGNVTSHNNN